MPYSNSMSVSSVETWAETATTEELTEAIEIEAAAGRPRKGALAALRAALADDLEKLIDSMTTLSPEPEPEPVPGPELDLTDLVLAAALPCG